MSDVWSDIIEYRYSCWEYGGDWGGNICMHFLWTENVARSDKLKLKNPTCRRGN